MGGQTMDFGGLVTVRHGPPGTGGSGRSASAVYRLRADDVATAVKRDGQGSNF